MMWVNTDGAPTPHFPTHPVIKGEVWVFEIFPEMGGSEFSHKKGGVDKITRGCSKRRGYH